MSLWPTWLVLSFETSWEEVLFSTSMLMVLWGFTVSCHWWSHLSSAVRGSLAGQGVSSWSGGATCCFAKETLTNVQCSNDSLLHPHKFVIKERSKCHLKPPHERKLVQMHVRHSGYCTSYYMITCKEGLIPTLLLSLFIPNHYLHSSFKLRWYRCSSKSRIVDHWVGGGCGQFVGHDLSNTLRPKGLSGTSIH